jgi:uncharacterized RDD family membrane protein YckC/type II secretory pathway pseudopilin PulG
MSTTTLSHYDLLEVASTASTETIRSAHASLVQRAKQMTPSQTTSERLQRLDTAFVVLSDPDLRRRYDLQLAQQTTVLLESDGEVRAKRQAAEAFYKRPRPELAQAAFNAADWAGFWRRFAANWVDSILLYVPVMIVFAAAIGVAVATESEGGAGVVSAYVAAFITAVVYHGLFIGSKLIASPGRMAVGIAVVDSRTAEPIGIGRGVLRSLVSLLSYLLILPNLVMLFTRRKQSVADLLAGTVVVKYKPGSAGIVVAVIAVIVAIAVIGILAAIAIPQYQDYVVRARLAEVKQDLNAYSELVEEHVRATTSMPESLQALQYTPRQKTVKYSISKNGSLVAELSEGGRVTGRLALRSEYSRETNRFSWTCVSDGMRASIRPKDCPQVQ